MRFGSVQGLRQTNRNVAGQICERKSCRVDAKHCPLSARPPLQSRLQTRPKVRSTLGCKYCLCVHRLSKLPARSLGRLSLIHVDVERWWISCISPLTKPINYMKTHSDLTHLILTTTIYTLLDCFSSQPSTLRNSNYSHAMHHWLRLAARVRAIRNRI